MAIHSSTGRTRNSQASWRLVAGVLLYWTICAAPMQARSQASISSDGAPSYTYPIKVPPGIAGMAPNINLLYSASRVNGPVGYGWTIQGVSMITRCAANREIDGIVTDVAYSVSDKLCLDGQRLIQTDADGTVINGSVVNPGVANPFQQNDSLGGTGLVREYRTEKDIYARIRAYGSAGRDPANGPAYFKVWTRSGQIYEYGVNSNTTANAQITAQGKTIVTAWPVARISDTTGNYMDFQYEQRELSWGSMPVNGTAAGREWNLTEIRYTGNGGQPPANRVVFEYIDRPDLPNAGQDRAETYHQGSKNVSIRLLDRVRTYINWPANPVNVKTLRLAYDNGPISRRSRLKQIAECTGDEAKCLPPASFNYSAGGNASYQINGTFKASALSTLKMHGQSGDYGLLQGDFNGDGKTDFIRWSDTVAENELYLSNASAGSFTPAANFNIRDQNLAKRDGCYISLVTDLNGDGLPDIFRYSASTTMDGIACSSYGPTYIYRNNSDGSFTRFDYSGPVLERLKSKDIDDCVVPRTQSGYCAEPARHKGWTRGATFFLLDVDSDGRLDLITTTLPALGNNSAYADACGSTICTRVYAGNGLGGFTEIATSLANISIYVHPSAKAGLGSSKYVNDVNGDGLADLAGLSTAYFNRYPVFRSRGDGSFDGSGGVSECNQPIDFNGDGRSDCIYGSILSPSVNLLLVADGTGLLSTVTGFNLVNAGNELDGTSAGFEVADIDGDGRTDILRWKDDPAQNTVYLSNGDGTFRQDDSFNLTASHQLQKSDGTASFITGDFTGRGNVEILRLKANPGASSDATRNLLYEKIDATQPDQLISVVSATGLTTTLTWVPLTNSASGSLGARYLSDRGTANAASYPMIDLAVPMQVVASSTSDSGVGGSTLTTEYRYLGLKGAYDGRGWLGFRETRRQVPAPNNETLAIITQYLQHGSSKGAASMTKTWRGLLDASSAPVLSSSTYIYCDKTAAEGAETAATSTAPCQATSRVQRPYLYQSIEEGWDLDGQAMPKVTTTNTFNDSGDPTQIVVSTNGTALGAAQTSTKKTVNQYFANNTAGDNWLLGRLQKATVQNSVPDTLPAATAGNAAHATSTEGVPLSAALSPTALTLNAGTDGVAAGAVSVMPAGGIMPYTYSWTRITGTRSGVSNGTVSSPAISASLAPGDNFTDTWQATVTDAVGNTASASINVTLRGPAALALTGCSNITPTVTPAQASTNCTLSNVGQTGIGTIAYSAIGGTTVSGPTGACAANSTCGTVTVLTGTAIGTYAGTLTATPNTGLPASTGIYLNVDGAVISHNPASLEFGTVKKGFYKRLSLTLTNTGTIAATGMTRNMAIVGGSRGQFTNTSTCSTTLAAGASCSITITYWADCAGGSLYGTLTTSGWNFSAAQTSLSATTSSSGICQ